VGGYGGIIEGGSAVGGLNVEFPSSAKLINCTVSENIASAGIAQPGATRPYWGVPGFGAGGISTRGGSFASPGYPSGELQALNCIVANNRGSVSPIQGPAALTPNDGIGQVNSLGRNLIGTLTPLASIYSIRITNYITGFTNSDLTNLNPTLGIMQDNGGNLPTYKPLPGSPAIDAASNPGIAHDQRGRPRTCDGRSVSNPNGSDGTDIGAVEVETSMCYQLVTVVSNEVQITFSSELGIEYGIQFKTNHHDTVWSFVPHTIEGTGDLITLENLEQFRHPAAFFKLFER
jgi:hypothetical protein